MSDCSRFEELISLSVSGELTPSEREELRLHLAGCEACRVTHARETRLWALIQQSRAAAPAAPEGLSDRLALRLASLAQGPGQGRSAAAVPADAAVRRRWLPWAAAAAALVLLALLLGLRGGSGGAPVEVAEVRAGRLLVKDGEGWVEARRLLSGQVFRVPGEPGSSARLELADGSRLDLERGMTGWLGRGFAASDRAGRKVELCGGALTAEVAKGRGEFRVKAPGGEVTATGTRFWVRSGAPEGKEEGIVGRKEIVSGTLAAALAVAVFEGSVLVQAAGAAEPVPVRAGEQAAAAAGAPLAVGERTVASAVPADALFFVGAAAREKWEKAFTNSSLGAAYREEEVKAFLKPVLDKLNALLDARRKQFEENLLNAVKLADVEKTLTGETGMAVLGVKAKDGGGEEPILLFIAEVGQKPAPFEKLMDEFVQRVKQMAPQAELRARAYRGSDLRSFAVEGHSIAYAQAQGYFLWAFDPAVLEKAIDCLDGAAPSLAADPLLRKSENGLLSATASLAGFIKQARAKDPDDRDWKIADALGFTAARRLTYRLDFDKPLFREKLSAEVSEARGLLSLLKDARPVDAQKLAANAPADALFFTAANLPADKVVPALFGALDAADPKAADKVRREFLQVKERGLDIEALLGRSLTGEVALWATMPPAGAGMFPEVVAVLGTRENAAAEAMIQLLAREAAKAPIRQRIAAEMRAAGGEVDWNKVNEQAGKEAAAFKLEPVDYKGGRFFALPQEKGNPIAISALVLPDRVILASSAMAAKRAASKPAPALADKAEFRDALSVLSPGAVGVQYIDTAKAFGMVYGTAAPFLAALPNGDKLKQRWGLDLKLLPPGELLTKHLAPEAAAFYADGKGLRLEARTNLPRALIVGAVAGGVAAQQRQFGRGPGGGGPAQPVPIPEHEEF
ncbi:MAG TPA: DUF3352 domain-containing protein [Planctomycetota bacterium]|nr:DUF3352 domain-containing protein [Planctomycetota bacterium]